MVPKMRLQKETKILTKENKVPLRPLKATICKQKKRAYFPIQNLLNIFSSRSSVVTAPVISPK